LWGLCDAASAASLYAHTDYRVSGLILLNPWMRTEGSLARTYIKSHYRKKIFDIELWKKIKEGNFNYISSILSFLRYFLSYIRSYIPFLIIQSDIKPLPVRMASKLCKFKGTISIILSERDMTADEFRNVIKASREWRSLLKYPNLTMIDIKGADHTFSKRIWSLQVEELTYGYILETKTIK
jgi:hypothetical protein